MLELRLIHHALTLARHRNYARAAQSLHLSQPTMSRSIASLERALGVRLFDRSPAGVEPTSFGRLLLERGERLLAGEVDLRREIQLHAGVEIGSLAVSAGPYPFEISVGTAVTRLIAAHPRLKAQVTVADPRDVVRDVLAGRIDVGVVDIRVIGDQDRLSVEPLPMHDIFLACRPGHPLAGRTGLSRQAVFAYPIASTIIPGDSATEVVSADETTGMLDPTAGDFLPAILVNSHAAARQIASGTDALVPGVGQMLAADVDAGRLVLVNYHATEMRTRYGIVRLRDRTPSPCAQAFVELLRDVEADVVKADAHGKSRWSAKKRKAVGGRTRR